MAAFSYKLKCYLPHILIVFFFINLGAAIYFHIDGLGIFSLTCAIIIFALAIYTDNKKSNNGGGGTPADSNIIVNMSSINDFVMSRKFYELAIPLVTILLTILTKKLSVYEKFKANDNNRGGSLSSESDDDNFDSKPSKPRKD